MNGPFLRAVLSDQEVRQLITDAYERCAQSAENLGDAQIAAGIRKAAGHVEVQLQGDRQLRIVWGVAELLDAKKSE